MSYQLPSDPQAYYETVWDIVRQVPRGCVTTYGQIASMIPAPPDIDEDVYRRIAPRWVGNAMNNAFSDAVIDKKATDIPWQRVINGQGGISMKGPSGQRQRRLLEAEDVAFDTRGRVDFDQVGWDGPPEEWLNMHNLEPPKSLKSNTSPADNGPKQLSLF